MCDGGNLHLAEGGQDVGLDLLPIDPLGRWPLARKIVPLESRTEVGNDCRRAVLFLLTDRISAAVDGALESLGFLACCSHTPIGKRANRELPLPPVGLAPIIQNEGARACGGDATAEALDRGVKGDLVAMLGDGQAAEQIVRQLLGRGVPGPRSVITKIS